VTNRTNIISSFSQFFKDSDVSNKWLIISWSYLCKFHMMQIIIFILFFFISDWYLQSWCSGYSGGAKIQVRKTSSKDLMILVSHVWIRRCLCQIAEILFMWLQTKLYSWELFCFCFGSTSMYNKQNITVCNTVFFGFFLWCSYVQQTNHYHGYCVQYCFLLIFVSKVQYCFLLIFVFAVILCTFQKLSEMLCNNWFMYIHVLFTLLWYALLENLSLIRTVHVKYVIHRLKRISIIY
jgi:hypothetical protein